MIFIIFIGSAITSYFNKFIGMGIVLGGILSYIQFLHFKGKLKRGIEKEEIPSKETLSYFVKLGIAILGAILIAQINKMIAIGFLIGLPVMQLAIISTAFNKKLLERFMMEKSPDENK